MDFATYCSAWWPGGEEAHLVPVLLRVETRPGFLLVFTKSVKLKRISAPSVQREILTGRGWSVLRMAIRVYE